MRTLLQLMLLLASVGAWGAPGLPYFAKTGSADQGWSPLELYLKHWWVFTDVDTNNATTNAIPDRIGGLTLYQPTAARQPTNTAIGWRFSGGQCFTNPAGFDVSTITWLVMQRDSNSAVQYIMTDGAASYGLLNNVTPVGKMTWNIGGGNAVFGSPPTNSFFDVLLSQTNSGGIVGTRIYTNGVFALSSGTYNSNYTIVSVGATKVAGSPFLGYIKEIVVASNEPVLFPTIVSNLHKYGTNKYGYSP